uniref:Calcineurin-like phosphoesterase n=1 Tax=viral metagenome TaxID=1070528 RepID=A0A6H1Z9K0_9ZZZZ
MDAELIRRWNETVSEGDVVYFLGDFCMGDPRKYFRQLRGLIYFIPGSHDKEIAKLGNILPPIYILKHDPPITLCHYALRSWSASHYGTWHLHGHHHGRLEPYGMSFDVGVDCWDYTPVSIEAVAKKMSALKPIVDYRKK